MSDEQLLSMFCDGTVYSFERASELSPFTFGGPFEPSEQLSGVPTGPRPLHLVARLSLQNIPEIRGRRRLSDLPLIYGFNYDGCEIKYRITPGGIKIQKLWPAESSEDFPYANYPLLLPYVPLKLSEARRCTYPEFAEEILDMAEEPPAELVVAVHPPATLGMSLWGPSGDAEGVVVVFECQLANGTVRAFNRCT